MTDFKVGQISHYYDKIKVAVLDLSDDLNAGDTIRISGHGTEFTQQVQSMQMEHQDVPNAKKGQSVGLLVDQPVKEGDEVFRVSP